LTINNRKTGSFFDKTRNKIKQKSLNSSPLLPKKYHFYCCFFKFLAALPIFFKNNRFGFQAFAVSFTPKRKKTQLKRGEENQTFFLCQGAEKNNKG
jgi:hypothetical protein